MWRKLDIDSKDAKVDKLVNTNAISQPRKFYSCGGLDANILHTVSEGKVFGGELLAAAREYNIIQLLIINICIVTAWLHS